MVAGGGCCPDACGAKLVGSMVAACHQRPGRVWLRAGVVAQTQAVQIWSVLWSGSTVRRVIVGPSQLCVAKRTECTKKNELHTSGPVLQTTSNRAFVWPGILARKINNKQSTTLQSKHRRGREQAVEPTWVCAGLGRICTGSLPALRTWCTQPAPICERAHLIINISIAPVINMISVIVIDLIGLLSIG